MCAIEDEIRIESLKPSTKYMLVVSAKNEVGVGRPFMLEVVTERARKFATLDVQLFHLKYCFDCEFIVC